MAYSIDAAFKSYYDSINLSGDFRELATTRRDHIFSLLQNRLTVIDVFAGGSIPKYTALKNHADLDIFVVLHYGKHCKDKSPAEVLSLARNCLAAKPGVRRNGQAVTLRYTTFPDVDVVPVFFTSHDGQKYSEAMYLNVPDMNTGNWIRSTPQKHASNISAAAVAYGPEFRRLIKFVKHWNWKNGDLLRSFHIECLALTYLPDIQLDDVPWSVFSFFQTIHSSLQVSFYYQDAVVDDYLSLLTRAELVRRISIAENIAREAWFRGASGEIDAAITNWKKFFGSDFPTYG